MAKAVLGLFDSLGQAQNAVKDLIEAGIDRNRIGVVTAQGASEDSSEEGKTATLAAGVGAAAVGALGLGMALGPVAIPGKLGVPNEQKDKPMRKGCAAAGHW